MSISTQKRNYPTDSGQHDAAVVYNAQDTEHADYPQHIFQTGGTTRMQINATGVGIGTASPERGLHVVGGIHMPNASVISFDQADGTLRNAIYVDSGDDMIIGDTNFDDIYFSTGQKTKTVVIKQTTGNVGIGTTAPDTPLHIQTNDSTTNALVNSLMITNLSTGTTTTGFGGEIRFQAERNNGVNQNTGRITSVAEVNSGTNISSGLGFWTGTAGVTNERMRISYDGKVGIGTTSPTYPLDVVSNSSAQAIKVRGRSDHIGEINMTNNAGDSTYSQIQSHSTELKIKTLTDIPMSFYQNNAEVMRIHCNGKVGIIRTPPASYSELEVGGADNVALINAEGSGVFAGLGTYSGGLGLYVNNSIKLTCESNGKVYVPTGPIQAGTALMGGDLSLSLIHI